MCSPMLMLSTWRNICDQEDGRTDDTVHTTRASSVHVVKFIPSLTLINTAGGPTFFLKENKSWTLLSKYIFF
jgi:hypothetical protein